VTTFLLKSYKSLKATIVKFTHSGFFKTMKIIASPKIAEELGYKIDHEQGLRHMIKPAIKAAFVIISVGVVFFLIWG